MSARKLARKLAHFGTPPWPAKTVLMHDFNFVPSGEPVRTKLERALCLVSMPVSSQVAAGAHRPDLADWASWRCKPLVGQVATLALPTPEKRRSGPLVALPWPWCCVMWRSEATRIDVPTEGRCIP